VSGDEVADHRGKFRTTVFLKEVTAPGDGDVLEALGSRHAAEECLLAAAGDGV
jgi:hypothetical protein